MKRHPLDRPAPDDSVSRARAFVQIQRTQTPHPATRALQRQQRDEQPQPLTQAMRIARGITA